jgi:hypothetical protein
MSFSKKIRGYFKRKSFSLQCGAKHTLIGQRIVEAGTIVFVEKY